MIIWKNVAGSAVVTRVGGQVGYNLKDGSEVRASYPGSTTSSDFLYRLRQSLPRAQKRNEGSSLQKRSITKSWISTSFSQTLTILKCILVVRG